MSLTHLVLVRIMKEDTLCHEVRDHTSATQRRNMSSNYCQHFCNKGLHETTKTTILIKKSQLKITAVNNFTTQFYFSYTGALADEEKV